MIYDEKNTTDKLEKQEYRFVCMITSILYNLHRHIVVVVIDGVRVILEVVVVLVIGCRRRHRRRRNDGMLQ